ncbi:MAG: FprA family A-type flavoprotein [Muribaculaceae bacterium]|nr:FprA family A-type flavoprotein [Muribaculaceae bacterium]
MTRKVSDNVYYIGVNDRSTHKFEALWPIPMGVSYNSYLVVGSDKAAIIDGVEVSHALSQIESIKEMLGDRQPDYLVINHIEPDHSGSVELLLKAFPSLTIIGNAQTIAMLKGFYGVIENTLVVKNGTELSLGEDLTMSFTLTPMVHWPETMMTLLKESKILFSGDAFGCFGALNGAVVDEDMDVEPYFPEMVRYYSNIVGKYGQFVQRAFAQLSEVEFNTVCPTHGPVWREHLKRVADIYNSLSLYEPLDNGATIVYGSMYGNTLRMVEAVAEGLAEAGVRNISIHNASVSDLSYILADIFRHKYLVIAAPTYSDGLFPPIEAVVSAITTRGIANRRVALLGSHTWSPRAVKAMTAAFENTPIELSVDTITIKHTPDASAIESCRSLGCELATK